MGKARTDLHRAEIAYDALNTVSGEVRTGRIRPASRDTFRAFLARYADTPTGKNSDLTGPEREEQEISMGSNA